MAKTVTLRVSHNTLLYVAIGVIVAALLVLNAYAFLRPSSSGNAVEKTAENFDAFKAAENPSDTEAAKPPLRIGSADAECATPPGYTDAEWKEHLGHHPDLYQECL